MKNRKHCSIAMMAALLSLVGGLACAVEAAPLTPEYAAKKENHHKQKEQQITPEKKKAAADHLKAERFKVYQAKQAVKKGKPETPDNK
jgi:predicted outer membrane protein